jgi:lipopolysaccharide assembly outer membrane protein LptD (OstA)
MISPLRLFLLLCFVVNCVATEIEIKAEETSFDQKTNLMTASGSVVITYDTIVLHADEVTLNRDSGDVSSTGNVRLIRGTDVWTGDHIQGNIHTNTFAFPSYQSTLAPWYIRGGATGGAQAGTIVAEDTSISTCEHLLDGHAHWRLEAGELAYSEDGHWRARDVVYKVGNFPVFYTPVAAGSTSTHVGNYEIKPGYKSDWGPHLDVSRSWDVNEDLDAGLTLGYRAKRGPSGGLNFDHAYLHSKTDFSAWGILDDDPPADDVVAGVDYNGRFEAEENRFRMRLSHRSDFSEAVTLRADIDARSDRDMLVDFDRHGYRSNGQPTSAINLGWFGERLSASIDYQPQVNDFESVIERLPELRLSLPRQQVADSRLYYQSETTAATLRVNWREYDRLRDDAGFDPSEYATTRLDTQHMVFMPFKLDWLNIVPRAGAQLTWYDHTSEADVTTDQLRANLAADDPLGRPEITAIASDYDDDGGARTRWAYELGMELSFKMNATIREGELPHIGTGLHRVLQPYVNYTWMPDPSVDKDNLYYFDTTDRLDRVNYIRFGVRDKLLTKRHGRTHVFARNDTFFDLYPKPEGEREHHNGDIGEVGEINFNEDISVWYKLLIDTSGWDAKVVNIGMRLGKSDRLSANISYLYRDAFESRFNHSMAGDHTRIFSTDLFPVSYELNHNLNLRFNLPLDSRTGLSAEYYLDLDQGSLLRQEYELTRRLHCWTSAVRVEKDAGDLSLYLLLYLNAFPDIRLNTGI